MEYKEALKKVQTKKVKENLLVIELFYDKKFVLPYKEGMLLLTALEHAEQLNDCYGKRKNIIGLQKEAIRVHVLSHAEYEQIKIAALLDVSVEEVQRYELETA